MSSCGKSVISLVGALYEAASEPARWEDFLDLAKREMSCETAVLTLHDELLQNWTLQCNSGLPSEGIQEYNAHYGAINPTIRPLFETTRRNGSWYGRARSLTGESAYRRSEYYNDFGRKYGSYWGVMGAVVQSPRTMITLSAVRSEHKPAPDQGAVEMMGLLIPHFASVIRICRSMEALRSMARAAVAATDAFEAAMVAVDATGRVLLTNEAAESVFREDDGLLLARNRLSAENQREARALEFLIQSAAATGAGNGTHPGGSMLIHRDALRPLRISVVPFHTTRMLANSYPCALIFISDPDAQPVSRASVLSSLYGLTPSECRLLDLLLRGLELTAAAKSLRITHESARFVLKSIFRKTGTHRQAELMRFSASLPCPKV